MKCICGFKHQVRTDGGGGGGGGRVTPWLDMEGCCVVWSQSSDVDETGNVTGLLYGLLCTAYYSVVYSVYMDCIV